MQLSPRLGISLRAQRDAQGKQAGVGYWLLVIGYWLLVTGYEECGRCGGCPCSRSGDFSRRAQRDAHGKPCIGPAIVACSLRTAVGAPPPRAFARAHRPAGSPNRVRSLAAHALRTARRAVPARAVRALPMRCAHRQGPFSERSVAHAQGAPRRPGPAPPHAACPMPHALPPRHRQLTTDNCIPPAAEPAAFLITNNP